MTVSAAVFESLAGLPCPVNGKEAWNYVKVRDGAHMFWWLYYADSPSAEFKDLPLVMWLQVGHNLRSFGSRFLIKMW